MSRALAIAGSPRGDGNTVRLLRRCLGRLEEAGHETELVSLQGKIVQPCRACGACKKNKDMRCIQKEDDFPALFESMLRADILVVGSPVYFGSAAPETMALLDRAGYVGRANGNPFARKIGGPVAVARRAGQNFTYAQLLYWFMINDMIVPGSSYWPIAFGREAGDVESDEEGLATIDRFADNLAWLAAHLPAGDAT
jgi:multimeric flavodoxin WrbA